MDRDPARLTVQLDPQWGEVKRELTPGLWRILHISHPWLQIRAKSSPHLVYLYLDTAPDNDPVAKNALLLVRRLQACPKGLRWRDEVPINTQQDIDLWRSRLAEHFNKPTTVKYKLLRSDRVKQGALMREKAFKTPSGAEEMLASVPRLTDNSLIYEHVDKMCKQLSSLLITEDVLTIIGVCMSLSNALTVAYRTKTMQYADYCIVRAYYMLVMEGLITFGSPVE